MNCSFDDDNDFILNQFCDVPSFEEQNNIYCDYDDVKMSEMLNSPEHDFKPEVSTGPTSELNKKENENITNENDEINESNDNENSVDDILKTDQNINTIQFTDINVGFEENENNNNNVEITENQRGRRNNDEVNNNKPANHTKFSEDNIMRKIKGAINAFILDLLNNSIKNKKFKKTKFLPLNTDISKNLKIDLNIALLNRTIYDIFTKTGLNERHKSKGDWNKNLINKIMEENIEKKTIYILSLKYYQILEYIKNNKLDYILGKIRTKEEKSKNNENFNLDKYMGKVKELFLNYEEWFDIRKARKTEKKPINIE